MQDKWATAAQSFYDDKAARREFKVLRYKTFIRSYKKLYSRLQMDHNSEILDIGCGSGEMTHALKNKVRNITGIDISSKSLEIARQNNPDKSFVMADMTAIPFDTNQFDFITAMTSLEFCFDKTQALAEIYRLLKNDGKFYVEVRNLDFILFRLTKFANALLIKTKIIVPYEANSFRDLGYTEWQSLLSEGKFNIAGKFSSLRPWNHGSLVSRIKNLIIRVVMVLTPINNHYMIGFLCVKKQQGDR